MYEYDALHDQKPIVFAFLGKSPKTAWRLWMCHQTTHKWWTQL